ncbi:MAG: type II toxin-antitoxin system VapC family toxin [Pseudomonadota bacterium]
MTAFVVDASVACKWFVGESGSETAEGLLSSETTLIAPDLVVPEVCNVVRTKAKLGQMTAEQAALAAETVADFFDEIVPSAGLAATAFRMASAFDRPAYACFYLALAEARNARLVSADFRFADRVRQSRWAGIVMPLSDLNIERQ